MQVREIEPQYADLPRIAAENRNETVLQGQNLAWRLQASSVPPYLRCTSSRNAMFLDRIGWVDWLGGCQSFLGPAEYGRSLIGGAAYS